MNPDQRANLDAAVLSVGESLAVAWSYFHVLRGLDNGRLQNPNVVLQHGLFYDRLWRVAFDAFFAKVGIVLDSKRRYYSLPNLLTLARKYGTPELRRFLLKIQNEIDALQLARQFRIRAVERFAAVTGCPWQNPGLRLAPWSSAWQPSIKAPACHWAPARQCRYWASKN